MVERQPCDIPKLCPEDFLSFGPKDILGVLKIVSQWTIWSNCSYRFNCLTMDGHQDIKMWAGRSQSRKSPKSPKSPKKKTKATGPGTLVTISQKQGPGRTRYHPLSLSYLIILHLILFWFYSALPRCWNTLSACLILAYTHTHFFVYLLIYLFYFILFCLSIYIFILFVCLFTHTVK